MKNLTYLLGLFVVILAFVAVDFYNQNKQLERAVYAAQSRDFSAATEKLSLLHTAVEQSLLFQDEKTLATELDSIWRLSSDLRKSVANLPLQPDVQNEWMRYLGKIGDSAKQATSKGTYEDWQQKMTTVASNLHAFAEEWNIATVAFYNNDGDMQKWTNNQTLALSDSPFVNASKQLKSYNETDFPLTASESDYEKKRDLQHLKEQKITKDQAVETFKKYFPNIDDAIVTISKSKDDAPYPFYHIQFVRGSRIGYADITEKGGHLLSFLMERPVSKERKSHEEILNTAQNFMQNVGYSDVTLSESRENHEAWHFVFTRTLEDNSLVYPDSIQVKVAKDTGEIFGVNAMEYIQEEKIPTQGEIPIKWDAFFADNVVVEETKKIYTTNATLDLRKCYEVIARSKTDQNDTYRIVIDTETHDVIKIEKVH
ncbi:germination protein YpeB [Solibacillus sp. MA9]|uniref:Germination protein YpeB n=1 Tax=Solibacillus palustris TaxID=2908203 RepID=A0ABS9UA54_9BACL|nr:PepSY1/2 domain-containing protein [Solibacillus sp. MA9]MCH7321217.1 germination protein YpeB [Solibacillus sp. MA9]